VILSNCVINLTEDKGEVFKEAFRALKPGGRLEVSDVVTSGAFPVEDRQRAGEWASCVSGALPEQEYLDLIAQAGFEEVIVRGRSDSGQTSGWRYTAQSLRRATGEWQRPGYVVNRGMRVQPGVNGMVASQMEFQDIFKDFQPKILDI